MMRNFLGVLLALSWPATAWTGQNLRLVPARIAPLASTPIALARISLPSGLQLLPVPARALDTTVLSLAPAPARAEPITAAAQAAPVGNLAPVIKLTQDISRQQAAAGGDIAAAAPELAQFFDGKARGGHAGGLAVAHARKNSPRTAPRPMRSLESIRELRFGTYNVENLFQSVGRYVPDLSHPGKRNKVSPAQPKPKAKQRGVARAILDADLDVVSVEEVENIQALQDFNKAYLGGKYVPLLLEGNDERGIDIGFLVKNDIPFETELRTNKDELWTDPEGDGRPEKLFSRDLPALIVRAPGRAQPLFVYLGTHYKSKRHRSHSDPLSEKLRRAQVERTVEIIARLRGEFGQDVPIMLGGDFNGAVNEEATFDALKGGKADLTDALDLAQPPLKAIDRVTHTYHPRKGPSVKSQLDAILISRTMRPLVVMARVYRYKGPDGKEKPLPKNKKQRNENPSDHFPLLVTVKFQPLLHP